MIKRTILLSSLLLFISCIKIYNRKQLVNDYEINFIKGPNTDGFYYFQNNIDGEVWVHAILFFGDGYFLNLGYVPSCGSLFGKKINDYCQNLALENSLESALKNTECVINNYGEFFNQGSNFINRKSLINRWGKYIINNNTLTVQYFYNYLGDYYLTQKSSMNFSNNVICFDKQFSFKNKRVDSISENYTFKKVNIDRIGVPATVKKILKITKF